MFLGHTTDTDGDGDDDGFTRVNGGRRQRHVGRNHLWLLWLQGLPSTHPRVSLWLRDCYDPSVWARDPNRRVSLALRCGVRIAWDVARGHSTAGFPMSRLPHHRMYSYAWSLLVNVVWYIGIVHAVQQVAANPVTILTLQMCFDLLALAAYTLGRRFFCMPGAYAWSDLASISSCTGARARDCRALLVVVTVRCRACSFFCV